MRAMNIDVLYKKLVISTFFIIFTMVLIAPSLAADEELGASLLAEGIAYYEDESYEEALETFQKVLFLDPGSIDGAYYLGLTNREMLNYPEARMYLERVLSIDVSNLDAQAALGEALYALERYDEAEAALDKAEGSEKNFAYIAFIRGLIAMQRKDYNRAITEFEASNSVQSAYNNKATFYLAMAYLEVGKKEKGKSALISVSQNEDEPIFARQAEAMLKKIKTDKKKKPLSLLLSYSIEIDDNVLLKPSEEISGVVITGEEDITNKLSFKAGYKFSFDKSHLNATYSFFHSTHDKQDNLDLMGHGASLAYIAPFKKGEYTLPLSFSYFLLDNDPYLQMFAARPTYGYSINANSWLIFNFSVAAKEFLQTPVTPDEDRNALNLGGGVSYLHFFKERKGNLTLGYALDFEETSRSGNWSYIGNKASLSFLYPLWEKVSFQAIGLYYNQAYNRKHSFYGKTRIDNFYMVEPKVTYRFDKKVAISLRYAYSRSISNIEVYDYFRNVFTTSIEYKY